jgi:hypothetical protein
MVIFDFFDDAKDERMIYSRIFKSDKDYRINLVFLRLIGKDLEHNCIFGATASRKFLFKIALGAVVSRAKDCIFTIVAFVAAAFR